MARASRLLRKLGKKKKRPASESSSTTEQTLAGGAVASAHGGEHAKPRDPDGEPPDRPEGPRPRPGPVPPGDGGDPTDPEGPYNPGDTTGGNPTGGNASVNVAGTEFPAEFGPFLDQLARQAALDTSGQGYGIAQGVRDDLQAQVFRNYLTSLYGGDVLGINFDLPQPNMGELLRAIQTDTVDPALSAAMKAMGVDEGGGGTNPPSEPVPGPPGPRPPREPRGPREPDGPRRGEVGTSGQVYSSLAGSYNTAAEAAEEAAAERTQRYTPEQRAAMGGGDAGAKYGYSYGWQGYRDEPGHGKSFLKKKEQQAKHGAYAPLTWQQNWDENGNLIGLKPMPNQTGRIAALKAKGLDPNQWIDPAQVLEPGHLQAIRRTTTGSVGQARNAFFAKYPQATEQPGGGMDAWKYWRYISKLPTDPATGWKINPSGELYNPDPMSIYSRSGSGNRQFQDIPRPGGGGGGGGTGGGGGGVGGTLSSFIGNIPGGGWEQRTSAFDPNNPRTWALMAPAAAGIAADKDRALRDIRAQVGAGGEGLAARADAINQAYGRVGGLRQGLITNALGYIQGRAHPDQPLPNPMGSAASGANVLGGKYSTDKQYNLGLQELTSRESLANRQADSDKFGSLFGMLGGLGGAAIIAA